MILDMLAQATIAAGLAVVGILYVVPLLRGDGVPRD